MHMYAISMYPGDQAKLNDPLGLIYTFHVSYLELFPNSVTSSTQGADVEMSTWGKRTKSYLR